MTSDDLATSTGTLLETPESLLIEYMNEQYAAARQQQSLRTQTLAIFASAGAVIFINSLNTTMDSRAPTFFGAVLILLGLASAAMTLIFYRGNRLHAETATACRKLLAKSMEADPVHVRSAVGRVAKPPRYNPKFKDVKAAITTVIEEKRNEPDKSVGMKLDQLLSLALFSIPILLIVGGLLRIVLK